MSLLSYMFQSILNILLLWRFAFFHCYIFVPVLELFKTVTVGVHHQHPHLKLSKDGYKTNICFLKIWFGWPSSKDYPKISWLINHVLD